MTPKQTTSASPVRRTLSRRSFSIITGAFSRNSKQQADNQEIGDDRASTVTDERQRDTCQRNQLQRASQNDQRLQRENRRQATCQQRGEVRARVQGEDKPALAQQHEQSDH